MKIKTVTSGVYQPLKVEINTFTNEYGSFKSYGMFFDGDYICLHERDIVSIEA